MDENLQMMNKSEKNKIELTGNPFVDTGLAVIATLAKLDDINKLTLDDIKKVHGDGFQITLWNSKLKSFTQIFGTNNSLFQTSYGYKKGVGPSENNKDIYKNILKGLLESMQKPEDGPRCWACGTPSGFDFSDLYNKTISEVTKRAAREDKPIGRDVFPLAGSLGSDAQALPAASTSPHICPKCLFSIHYLPLGLILLDGRLSVFQCTSEEFWYDFIRDIVYETESRLKSGSYDTIGKKEGRSYIINRLLSWFDKVQREKKFNIIPDETTFYVWRFSNSGTSPECTVEEIPNNALTFLWEAKQCGLTEEVKSLIKSEGKNPFYSLYSCILDNREYPNLYPKNSKYVVSQKFFSLYQTRILKRSNMSLEIAYKIAKNVSESEDKKKLKRLQRPEANKDASARNKYRASMTEMASKGELTPDKYIELFPIKDGSGVSVKSDGFDIIRFYLYHVQESFIAVDDKPTTHNNSYKYTNILYYASVIYNKNVEEVGLERFERNVITEMSRGYWIEWLQRQFTKLAESKDGFDYKSWLNLCKLDDGRFAFELLFQLRLIWTYWASRKYTKVELPDVKFVESNNLPDRLSILIEEIFKEYINKRCLEKFHKDVLIRLRRREIGLWWFEKKMTEGVSENIQPLTEYEWDSFLYDSEGQSIKFERLFQLHLALANLYKVSNKRQVTEVASNE